jgi:hypothetical protein
LGIHPARLLPEEITISIEIGECWPLTLSDLRVVQQGETLKRGRGGIEVERSFSESLSSLKE